MESVHSPASTDHTPVKRVVGRPFAKGYDPRRATRFPAGAAYNFWLTELNRVTADGLAAYPVARLTELAGDPTQEPMKRKAAQTHLRAEALGFSRSGKPLAGDDLDRIADRTVGKPLQAVIVAKIDETPREVREKIEALHRECPELAGALHALEVGELAGPGNAEGPEHTDQACE